MGWHGVVARCQIEREQEDEDKSIMKLFIYFIKKMNPNFLVILNLPRLSISLNLQGSN